MYVFGRGGKHSIFCIEHQKDLNNLYVFLFQGNKKEGTEKNGLIRA